MRHNRTRQQQHVDSLRHHADMAERKPDSKAKDSFRRPAYQERSMIAAQGGQMEHKDVAEYLAKKYDIKRGMRVGQECSN